jgi:hypothetical protein
LLGELQFLPKFGKSSFLRKSAAADPFKIFWISASAGMTKWGCFSKVSLRLLEEFRKPSVGHRVRKDDFEDGDQAGIFEVRKISISDSFP